MLVIAGLFKKFFIKAGNGARVKVHYLVLAAATGNKKLVCYKVKFYLETGIAIGDTIGA